MSKSNATETDLLRKFFNNVALPWDGVGNLFVALHSSDPGGGGSQDANEISYTGYARVALSRDAAGWTVVGSTVSNTLQIQFGTCTAGSVTATHVSIGTLASGAGQILYSGLLNSPLNISPNVVPIFALGALQVTED